jgi:plasmid stability protein
MAKKRPRNRAAAPDLSMEAEAREILKVGLATPEPEQNLAQAIRELFEPLGGVHLPPFPDEPIEPIRFASYPLRNERRIRIDEMISGQRNKRAKKTK